MIQIVYEQMILQQAWTVVLDYNTIDHARCNWPKRQVYLLVVNFALQLF